MSWCGASSIDPLPDSRFGKELTRLGFEIIKGNAGNSRSGIRLAPTPEEAAWQPAVSSLRCSVVDLDGLRWRGGGGPVKSSSTAIHELL